MASPMKAAATTGSSSTNWASQGSRLAQHAACPRCGSTLVRIQSKQPNSLGEHFIKCSENIKDDPTTCGFILPEKKYQKQYEKHPSLCDGGQGSDNLQEELDEIKQKVDSVVQELWKLKVEVGWLKMEYVVVGSICVGVVIGVVLSKIWN